MARRQPTNRQMDAAMTETELPMNRPIVQESEAERLVWKRAIADARDEQTFIDAQIASAERINTATKQEAGALYRQQVSLAERAEERAVNDADRVFEATVEALRKRRADLDRKAAGYEAALAATDPPEA